MKKPLIIVSLLLVLSGGYLAVAHFSGGAFWTLGLALGGDRGAYVRPQNDRDRLAEGHQP